MSEKLTSQKRTRFSPSESPTTPAARYSAHSFSAASRSNFTLSASRAAFSAVMSSIDMAGFTEGGGVTAGAAELRADGMAESVCGGC
jgi:hypothetical protein